jgi:hypothetical protein
MALFKRMNSVGFPQTLLRYLAEVVIIFLGITISFLFEQWREGNRRTKEVIELSRSLLDDIDVLKAKLLSDLGGSTQWINNLDSVRVQRISNTISERQLDWIYRVTTGQEAFIFDSYSPTYIAAVNSGIINELPDSINDQLYQVYRVDLPFFQLMYDQQQQNITNFRDNMLVNTDVYLYQKDSPQVSLDPTTFRNELQRPLYGNFINQVIITEKEVYKVNSGTYKALTKVQTNLRNYIAIVDE